MSKLNYKEMEKYFQENIDMIKNEMDETDVFYTELKEHFDLVKKSSSSGALTFISKQTPNLVSLRNNKISLMSSLAQLKKTIIELSLKTQTDDSDDGNTKEILKGIHDLLIHNKAESYIEEYFNEVDVKNKEIDEEEIEASYEDKLNERMNTINEKKKEENDEEESNDSLVLNKDYTIVVDEEGNMYPVDKDYNVLEDVPLPYWEITMEEDEEGYIHAYNHYGDELEIIETDDEEETGNEIEDDEEYGDEFY